MSLVLAEPSRQKLPLPGIEADNLLALLATLGLLRALDQAWPAWQARVSWKGPPWLAHLHLAEAVGEDDVAQAAAEGIDRIVACYDVDGRKNVDFARDEFHCFARRVCDSGDVVGAALVAALSAEFPEKKGGGVRASPLVMMFGQGHQNFLERLVAVPRGEPNKRTKEPASLRDPVKIKEALFAPWARRDETDAFRWDPEEDQRYALRFGNPSRAGAAPTVHGANRLAALGFLSVVCAPGQSRLAVAAWDDKAKGFIWPIWTSPLSLRTISALLTHPDVLAARRDRLRVLGVAEVFFAQRVSNGKFMNVTRARPHSTEGPAG